MKKENKALEGLAAMLSFLFALFLLVLFGVVLIFLLPVDYIRYKRSAYYRDTKKRYRFLAALGQNFTLYNVIRRAALPIRFYCHPTEKSIEHGWVLYDGTLICPSKEPFVYDEEKGDFCITEEGEGRTLLTLGERLGQDLADFCKAYPDERCERALLFYGKEEWNDDLARAEADPRFLFWEGDPAAALAAFCGQNTSERERS
jgi:hypothetical protein